MSAALEDGLLHQGAVRSDGARWQPAPGTQSLADAYRGGTIYPLPAWIGRIIRAHPEERRQKAKSNSHSSGTRKNSASREIGLRNRDPERVGKGVERHTAWDEEWRAERRGYRMGRMTARGWIDRTCIADVLWRACELNGLVSDDGADAVQATLASGLTAGLQDPHPDLDGRQTFFAAGGRSLLTSRQAPYYVQSRLKTCLAATSSPANSSSSP